MGQYSGRAGTVLGVGLVVLIVLPAAADEKTKSRVVRRDPAGATAEMGKFRSLFAAWDLNQDGFLDKQELAKAFRGASAKPYLPTAGSTVSAKSIASKYPDHEFLIQLDQDNDGKVSRYEFMDWARSYVGNMKKLKDGEARISQKEKQLKANLTREEKKKLAEELKAERKALAEQKKELKHLQTIEKHLQHLK